MRTEDSTGITFILCRPGCYLTTYASRFNRVSSYTCTGSGQSFFIICTPSWFRISPICAERCDPYRLRHSWKSVLLLCLVLLITLKSYRMIWDNDCCRMSLSQFQILHTAFAFSTRSINWLSIIKLLKT